ncbi:MAG: SH3 domain-containing protein, partial [Propionibacteriaceae bacterium]|nr:SH3 domain-containing protein [Propionibacteriaceae bacterium]
EAKGKAKNGWQPVSFNNTTGYVYAQYIKVVKSTKTPITNAAPSTRKTSANVNLRDAANLNSKIIRVLKKGTAVAATGRKSGDFTEVKVDGKIRWLFTKYVGGTTTAAPSVPTPTPTAPTQPVEPETPAEPTNPELPDPVATVVTGSLLALRQSASEASAALGDLAAGAQVGLTGKHSGSYSEIIIDGKLAWVLTGYLKPSDLAPTVTLPVSIGLRYINATDVNVRKAADVESTKLATLARATVLQITGPTKNGYSQVIFSGGLAWVSTQYLSDTKPGPTLGSTSLDKLKATGKAAVLVVRDKFPEIKTIYGWRASSAYSSDHPNGRAIDIMIPSYKKNKALGDKIAKYFIDNNKSLKVKYVIWRQRNYTITRGKWVNMADRGGDTANHYDHVHVSFLS